MHHLCNSGDLKQSNEEDGDEDSYGDDACVSIGQTSKMAFEGMFPSVSKRGRYPPGPP